MSSYFNKVQARFGSNTSLPDNKFQQFEQILRNFDPFEHSVTDLYRSIEQLFGPANSDLIEEFLIFLTPGQAAEIGRFMEHFMITKMTKFVEILQV